MTDNEIIKELERRESCSTWNVATIPTTLLDQTINLIKSQKAEIDELQHKVKEMVGDNDDR